MKTIVCKCYTPDRQADEPNGTDLKQNTVSNIRFLKNTQEDREK